MADFSSTQIIKDNLTTAYQILHQMRVIYAECVNVQAVFAKYQTDAAFKAEADHLFTAAQLSELNSMIANINTLQVLGSLTINPHWVLDKAKPAHLERTFFSEIT